MRRRRRPQPCGLWPSTRWAPRRGQSSGRADCPSRRGARARARNETLKPVRLLVTGGAGYIGSIVARDLVEAGHEVVILDSLERGHREAVPGGAQLIEADLLDRSALGGVVTADLDGVLHFAALALVGESVSHPERYWRANVGGTLNLLEAMVQAGVSCLVFSSTCAVYGEPDQIPISEAASLRPINAYGATKLAVDQMIGHFCIAH